MTESPQKPQILFVDDEQPLLDLYRKILRSQADAWEMQFFSDSGVAWESVRHNRVDAIVSDVSMPHISGLQLLERLRSNPATCAVPVTLLTGLCDAGIKRQGLDLVTTDLLFWPVEVLDLLARLRSMLRRKSVEDELTNSNYVLISELD